jgi:signal transduction histidine kinase
LDFVVFIEFSVKERLMDNKEILQGFIDSATEAFSIWDSELNLVMNNEASMILFPPGDTKEGLIGKNIIELVPDVKESGIYDGYLRIIKTGEPLYIDDIVPFPTFGDKRFSLKAFKVGNGIGMIVSDTTDRKKVEEALQKAKEEIEAWNRELEKRVKEKTDELERSHTQLMISEKLSSMGQLAAGLAHELNSPLTGLLPLIQKYKEKAEKGTREYDEMTLMLQASEHMAKVVRDFGFFSRETKGRLADIDLNDAIEETLSFSSSHLKHGGIKLIKEYADRLPKVEGNETELKQVILNMITNARDAMPEGGKFIIRTGFSKDSNKVIMEFIDNGTGIEKKMIDKIYDPFFTTKETGEGTGLGLSLSYGIVMKHKGKMSAESEPGKGTKFKVILPASVK